MKQACYREEYGSTSAKGPRKKVLMLQAKRQEYQATISVNNNLSRISWGESLFAFERNKSRGSRQKRGKVSHERSHRRMPEAVESEIAHFSQGLIRRQFFKGHAVAGHKNAGAVLAVVAVNKNPFLRAVSENGKKLRDLFVCRSRPLIDGDMNEVNSQ